jgi:hypothetical protein
VEHGLLDDLFDLLVRDGGLLLEAVDGAAGLDGLEELLGCHCGWCRGESS